MTIWNILIAVSMWLVLLFSAGITQGCTGQAYELKIGFGQYTASKETRTFEPTKEHKNERPL